jgi:hypothetical protein
MSGNKGNLTFQNVIIGGMCPNGVGCKITIKDGDDVVCDKYPLAFQESFTHTARTGNITVSIKPIPPQMGSEKIKSPNKKSGPPKSNITYYICEDPYIYKVSVFSNKNHVPLEARPYAH